LLPVRLLGATMPAKGAISGHLRKSFNQLGGKLVNTARCLAFCHVRVLIEINGARRHRLLFHDGKPIGYSTLRDDHSARFQDRRGNTVRVFAYVRH
jgi:hypothetical protein